MVKKRTTTVDWKLGLGTEFCSEKFSGIDSDRFLLFRVLKCSLRGIPRSVEENQLRSSEQNGIMRKKLVLQNSQNNLTQWIVRTSKVVFSDTISRIFGCRFEKVIKNESFLFQQTELRACFLPWNALGQIPKVCYYFCSMERSSELFSLSRNRLEQNSESLLVFLLRFWYGILSIFLFSRTPERNSESFLFRGTARIPSEMIICFIYSTVRGIIFFCRKFPTLLKMHLAALHIKCTFCKLIWRRHCQIVFAFF